MDRKKLGKLVAANVIALAILVPLGLAGFQNCAPAAFDTANDSVTQTNTPTSSGTATGPGTATGTPTPTPGTDLALKDQLIQTQFNVAKDWNADSTGDRTGYVLSLDMAANLNTKTIATGVVVDIIDTTNWKLRVTPQNFRGEIKFWLFARRTSDGAVRQAQITIQVGNAVNLLAPALAVRATGCIICHAQVHSNIVTDFGFGNSYYFGGNIPGSATDWGWNHDMAYGDQAAFRTYSDGSTVPGAWGFLRLMSTLANPLKVYVPTAGNIPSEATTKTGATTLQGYVQHRLSHSFYAESKTGQALATSTVFIGAPTATRLKNVFGYTSNAQKSSFIADVGGAALSGLQLINNSYFKNTSTLVCEGDLLLDAPLHLENLVVQSRNGCRLYVTGSVFIYGPITYTSTSGAYAKANLQITSAKSVLMGLGSLWKNGAHCEMNVQDSGYWGYYANRAATCAGAGFNTAQCNEYTDAILDSAKFRLSYHWGAEGFFFRNDTRAGKVVTQSFYSEMMSTIGQQQDAACRPETRNVAFQRLLLNAPLVQSRYAGGFTGSIIAEVGLMALGLDEGNGSAPRFNFHFDPVFQQAEILPMLSEQDFLKVQ